MNTVNRRFSVAPMMEWTTPDCRYFLRLLSKRALLYSEMVTTGALIFGDSTRFLRHHESEHPVALQLGGSDPEQLATCAKMAEVVGFDEVNLNVGCPSDRVQNNMIGACLMAHPELVAECVKQMQDAVQIPITVKHRIGINGRDSYAQLCDFVGTVHEAGCTSFTVHARIAILEGLSPKETVMYLPVMILLRDSKMISDLEFILNGGIKTLEQCTEHLKTFDGVMLGREAYQNPWLLSQVDQQLFGDPQYEITRTAVLEQLRPYIEQRIAQGAKATHITRHLLGLAQGFPGARRFRQLLSNDIYKTDEPMVIYDQAVAVLEGR